jgi:hypothetical protein
VAAADAGVNDQLLWQALADPLGPAAGFVAARNTVVAQDRRPKDKQVDLLGGVLFARQEAVGRQGLLGRQRAAHFSDAGAYFNASRPGLDAQKAIAGAAAGLKAELELKARSPLPEADAALRETRNRVIGAQRLPSVGPVPRFAMGGVVGGAAPQYYRRGSLAAALPTRQESPAPANDNGMAAAAAAMAQAGAGLRIWP